jgi:hypothetical protein
MKSGSRFMDYKEVNSNAGLSNAQQLKNLVSTVDTANLIQGKPGNFSLKLTQLGLPAATPAGAAAAPALASPLSTAQIADVQSAVARSNTAATQTPTAASGQPTKASTSAAAIASAASVAPSTAADIKTFEAGAKGTLHWWGWELEMDESSTRALENVLTTDMAGLDKIAAALKTVSVPLAAVADIIFGVAKTVGGFANSWISKEDTAKNGVRIHGYMWLGVWMEPR